MKTTDEVEEKGGGTMSDKPEADDNTFVISHDEEDGLSVKIEAIPDNSDPATEGMGD